MRLVLKNVELQKHEIMTLSVRRIYYPQIQIKGINNYKMKQFKQKRNI